MNKVFLLGVLSVIIVIGEFEGLLIVILEV